MLSILFVACADDELYRSFSSSQVIKVKNLQLVASDVVEKEISLTRAADQPALLNSAMLFIFNEAGSREAVLDLVHADLTQYTDQNNDRVYTVTKEIELTVGTKTCYAIANIDNFSYLAIHKNEIGNITTQSELESYLLSINPTTVTTQGLPTIYETETQILPFTGQGKLQITETSEGNGTAKGIVNLYRPIAHIAFNINTSSENSEGSICNFALNNYTVYKVADCYPVFSIAENVIGTEEDSRQYYNTLQMQSYTESGGQAKFDFYIPENIQNSADDVANYHEREKWNYNTSVDGMKDWSYAPDNATYVVISGQYTETTKDGTLKYSGDVSYTIHLGDFSDDKWGNFSVERNCKYTYTVSIRIKGYPSVNETFDRITDAKEWASRTEADIKRGISLSELESRKHTLNELIDRYINVELPKRNSDREKFKMQLLWWKHKIGAYYLSNINTALLTQCKEELLNEPSLKPKNGRTTRSEATVNRYLACLSIVLSINFCPPLPGITPITNIKSIYGK